MNKGGDGLSKWVFVIPFFVIYIPLVWIRKTEKLAFTHLISDVIIAFVILTIMTYGGMAVTSRPHNEDLVSQWYMGPAGIGVGISSSSYAFEGIACVLPVREITAD
jgi:amino acid permease